jgi:cyclase
MLTRRSFIVGSTACAAVIACPSDSQPTGLRSIVPGVWLYEGDFLSNGQCNSVVIECKHNLIIVDANSASGAVTLQAEVKRLSPKPIHYVLLTHHHGDHIYGNAVWTRAGAITVAHETMLNELARLEPMRWRSESAHNPQMATLGEAPEAPRRTFAGPLWVLDDGERRVEVHHLGAAHTRDDVVVYLPREHLLCTGDIAISTSLNSFFDSNFKHWQVVLQAAARFQPRHVLPGHGHPGGLEILEGQLQFLTLLDRAVTQGLGRGQSPAQIYATLEIPGVLKPWVSGYLSQQVEQIYQQLKS